MNIPFARYLIFLVFSSQNQSCGGLDDWTRSIGYWLK